MLSPVRAYHSIVTVSAFAYQLVMINSSILSYIRYSLSSKSCVSFSYNAYLQHLNYLFSISLNFVE